jgi:hypothetical protein
VMRAGCCENRAEQGADEAKTRNSHGYNL